MNAKKSIFFMLILVTALTGVSFAARAESMIPAEMTFQRKFVRGVCNTGLGGIEVFYNLGHQDVGFIPGWLPGLFKGIGRTVTREVVGLYEIVTSPFVSSPVMHPEFVWELPDKHASYSAGKSLTELYPA